MCYFNIKIRRQFSMARMEPCMVRRMVAHFGQPGESVKNQVSAFQSKFDLSFYKLGKQIIVIKQPCSKLLFGCK